MSSRGPAPSANRKENIQKLVEATAYIFERMAKNSVCSKGTYHAEARCFLARAQVLTAPFGS